MCKYTYAPCWFSRNSRILSSILCRSVVPNFKHTGTVRSTDKTSFMSLTLWPWKWTFK
jgi:hypothetical protein